ncbi:hypothetical protein AB0J83_36405 [Actinoplanes sp. NPDC049596]|uniref:hypothetical protein n=1 Tax=unclassified Actinoplanes TaxID=2626549 RepID=UPI00341DEAE8
MRLFKKKARPEAQAEAIGEFWSWWATVRDEVAAAVEGGTVEGYGDAFGRRVDAIHPGLQWELSPGDGSAHALSVTPGGQAELRAVAARWLAAAPPADAVWSYRAARAADPSTFESVMEMGGHKLELSEIRYGVTVDQQRRQADVVCYHPAFAGLPDDMRGQVTFLSLDWAIGEDAVEIWLGEISWTGAEPAEPRTPAELRQAVGALAAGEDSWMLMQGQRDDGVPLLAMATAPLRPARWPRFDLHVPVRLPYAQYNAGQLPADESLEALRRFEDEVAAAIGGNGALVAHETSRRLRTLHFYVDAQSNARAEIESRLPQWREGRSSAEARLDPAFDGVRHLMQ